MKIEIQYWLTWLTTYTTNIMLLNSEESEQIHLIKYYKTTFMVVLIEHYKIVITN